jgi:hypothetical protein
MTHIIFEVIWSLIIIVIEHSDVTMMSVYTSVDDYSGIGGAVLGVSVGVKSGTINE